MRSIICLSLLALAVFFQSCNSNQLKVYGPKKAPLTAGGDSIDYTVPVYTFTDQDSNIIDAAKVQGKICVADFFFTSCPSICPKMMKEMSLVYDKYKNDGHVVILSYSIDPVRDSVPRLKAYERKLEVSSGTWHFLTGNKDSIYRLADKYLVSAAEDPDAAGGYIHDGNFILIDKNHRIRGYYNGTDETEVQKLLGDMDILLQEK